MTEEELERAQLARRVHGVVTSARLYLPPAARRELAGILEPLVDDAYQAGFGVAAKLALISSLAAENAGASPAPGEDWDHNDVEAIERVRALLES